MKNVVMALFLGRFVTSCSEKGSNPADIGDLSMDDGRVEDTLTSDVPLSEGAEKPDTLTARIGRLFPGPGQPGYDQGLADKALMIEREFWALHASVCGLDCEATVPVDRKTERELIADFVNKSQGWDFEAAMGRDVRDVVAGWSMIPGLYAGMGIGADAFRYALLRDRNAPSAEVERARQILLNDLRVMHIALPLEGSVA